MRLRLVIAASLLAAIVGAGSCIALVLGVFSVKALSSPGLLVVSTLLLPAAAIIFASIFVYRHTATPPKASGRSHCVTGNTADARSFCLRFDSELTLESETSGAGRTNCLVTPNY